jgi:uncharacterized protein (DUF1697 family)
MIKYVAMLRGIGPGNPNMTHEKFTSFFEGLGLTGVQVVLGSGNIIFEDSNSEASALAERIENALPQKLGFQRSVILRSEAELRRLIDRDPFKGVESNHNKATYLLVTFFKHTPTISWDLPYTPEGKPYTILGRIDDAVYGTVDLTAGKTPDYMAWLEKQLGKDITSRTPRTLRLILSKMGSL